MLRSSTSTSGNAATASSIRCAASSTVVSNFFFLVASSPSSVMYSSYKRPTSFLNSSTVDISESSTDLVGFNSSVCKSASSLSKKPFNVSASIFDTIALDTCDTSPKPIASRMPNTFPSVRCAFSIARFKSLNLRTCLGVARIVRGVPFSIAPAICALTFAFWVSLRL